MLSGRNVRTVIVLALVLLVVVSCSLSVASPPVQACNACNFLLTWGSFGAGNGDFSGPRGITVDSAGHVYVVDSLNNRVEKFTSTGGYLSQVGCPTGACSPGSGPGQFKTPWVVAVASGGNVYVTDYFNNRVEEFTSAGTYITAWGCATAPTGCSSGSGSGQLNTPRGVAVDSSGNVYVADAGNSRVEKFSSGGTFIATWGSFGAGNGNFSSPRGVAVDSAENVYVADGNNNRVEKFTGTGTYISQLGCASGACSPGAGNGEFNSPYAVAVDSSGNAYVTDGGNNRVELFGDSTLPVPEFSTVAVVAFSALAASVYLLKRRRK